MAKIYNSPSSQQANLGVIPGYVEETVCNKIADAKDAVLKAAGQEVMRNNPANGYAQHVAESNAWGADIHSCTHTNAASNPDAFGISVGCYDPADPNRESTKLAVCVQKRLQAIYPYGPVRLVKYTFAEITQVDAKTVYCEDGFHTNPRDCQWILDHIADIGKAEALGILDYLGIEYKEATLPPPEWQGKLDDANQTIAQKDTEIAALKSELSTAKTELIGWQKAAEDRLAESDKLRAMIRAYVAARDALDGA